MLPFLSRNSETERMSLIHEALQKAEAERRAGELPPLVSAAPMPRSPDARSGKLLWIVIGLAVLAAAAYTNRALILPAHDEPAPRPIADADLDVAPVEPLQQSAQPTVAARKPMALRQPPSAAPAMDAFTAAQTDAIAAKLGAGRHSEPELPGVPEVIEPMPAPAIPAPTIPAPKIPAPVPMPAAEPAVLANTSPKQPQAQAAVAPDLPTPTPKLAPADATATVNPAPLSKDEAQSSAATGSTPVQMIFDPSLRFAIIDGKRVNENGVVGNELNLIEIQRDALMLEYRGTRFLLPRIGR